MISSFIYLLWRKMASYMKGKFGRILIGNMLPATEHAEFDHSKCFAHLFGHVSTFVVETCNEVHRDEKRISKTKLYDRLFLAYRTD